MTTTLLVIDPQNDFCDLDLAALPVSGANADLQRLSNFVANASKAITDIIVTLDSHSTFGIERTSFWRQADGVPAPPFTPIAAEDVRNGRFAPRNPSLHDETLAYLDALETRGRYRLMVWPVHCVLGTWGHNIHVDLAREIGQWEEQHQRPSLKILKGLNPMTEQYSAVRAEVPHPDDPRTSTNDLLIARARPGNGLLVIAGEASSHCVAATLADILETLTPDERRRIVILKDCMSPVRGFEQSAADFFHHAAAQGVRVTTAAELQTELAG